MASMLSLLDNNKNYHSIDSKEQILYIETEKGEFGGYKENLLIKSLTEVESEFYVCRKCKGLMKNACLIGPEQIPACAMCTRITQVHITMRMRKKISELGVKCPLEKRGCEWKGIIDTINAHLDVCPEFIVNCTNKCEVTMKRSELINHCHNECQNRKTNCKHCRVIIVFKDIETHNKTCIEFPVLCPNQCAKFISRKQIELHVKNECPNTIIECHYKMTGCKKSIRRKEAEEHENIFETKHLRESVTYFLNQLELMEKTLKYSETKNELLEQENKRQSEEFAGKLKQCEWELKESTKNLAVMESEFASQNKYTRDTENLVRELTEDALYQTVVSDEIGTRLIAYFANLPTLRIYPPEVAPTEKFEFRWNQYKVSLIFNYVVRLQQFSAIIQNETFLKELKIKTKLTILDTKSFRNSLVFLSQHPNPIGPMGYEFRLAEMTRDQICEGRLRNTNNTISFMLQMQEVDDSHLPM